MRFSFVILHYLAADVTIDCIDTLIENFCGHEFEIVVVDNASPNGSGIELKKKYNDHRHVHFILSDSNLGFARGNNVGYKYACDNFNPDFIVVMNNDVLIKDKEFILKVEREYMESHFAALGPDIFCPITGKHQNPAHLSGFSETELLDLRNKLKEQLNHYFIKRLCWKFKLFLGLAHANQTDNAEEYSYLKKCKDCVLHGACYVFSKEFIISREYAFNPGTFMYFEEDILHYECMRDGLNMVYTPDICVYHLEDAATNMAFKLKLLKEKKIKERILESSGVMLDILRNDRKR